MNRLNIGSLHSLEWRPARYNGKLIGKWFISENGILYNPETDEIRYGHDNVKGKDLHQRISIKNKSYYISRIVAEAFVPNDNPKDNIVVRHLDDNPHNNHYSNLKWGTHHENTLDAIRNGKVVYDEKRNYSKCENHPNSILTNTDVLSIIQLLNASVPLQDIANKFNVDIDVIRHIYKGKSWRYLTSKYLPFPKQPLNRVPMNQTIKDSIIKIIMENPNAMPLDIVHELGIDYNNTNKTFIGKVKRYIKQRHMSSTTIES